MAHGEVYGLAAAVKRGDSFGVGVDLEHGIDRNGVSHTVSFPDLMAEMTQPLAVNARGSQDAATIGAHDKLEFELLEYFSHLKFFAVDIFVQFSDIDIEQFVKLDGALNERSFRITWVEIRSP